ncbi:MAG: nucleotidyl transferase AbiEii/AbiGii toxin family protein [Parcubacteria group bacterium]|nr:nucleotidyl transferase AbiEii/AbiGii toxin family protein [Parcubacteria group bacterium]
MFIETIPGELARNLESLGKQSWIKAFYLAGGTGCALQLGHRVSYDLDFFAHPADVLKIGVLVDQLKKLGQLEIEIEAEATLIGRLAGTKVSFFGYRYPLIAEPVEWRGIAIANIRDIGCMKLDAIQSRGKKRDFVDLLAIVRNGLALEELFTLFEKKYVGVQYNKIHLLKSLTYFSDAAEDAMPEMLVSVTWDDVKKSLESEVKTFARAATNK